MAIQTRYAGDANGVNNVDADFNGNLAVIVATGLTKSPTALKIVGLGTFVAGESATGGAVETILRSITVDSTVVMYQVDATQISVLLEACGSDAATIQARIVALGGNIGIAGNITASSVTVSSAAGFKLA